jgi:hypothetical protein
MLSLKPERSAIIRMNAGGRLQVDFVTVTEGATPLDGGLLTQFRTGPAARTMSEITSSTTIPTITSFLD